MCKKVQWEFTDELAHVWRWEQECQGLLRRLVCQSSSGVSKIVLQKLSIFSLLSFQTFQYFHLASWFCSSNNVNRQYCTFAKHAEMSIRCSIVKCVVVALRSRLYCQIKKEPFCKCVFKHVGWCILKFTHSWVSDCVWPAVCMLSRLCVYMR